MKRMMIVSLLAAFTMSALLPQAHAMVPGLIHHQGYLTDDTGTPIDGNVEMWFLIYDQEIDGSEIWSEGPMTLSVTDGLFQVLLGQVTPITPAHLSGPRWLEVIVEGEYLGPRERIVSSLFAIEAKNADMVDGAEAEALEESQEITDGISAHAAATDAHHAKTTSFTELTDTASDAQIPDDITVLSAATAVDADTASYATFAGNADTVDGLHASEFVTIGHDHDDRYYTQAYVDTLESRMAAMETAMAEMESIIGEMLDLGQFVSVEGTDIVFSGANVHVVNGAGDTSSTNNGLGNLTVGYNELRGSGDVRTGSHNLIVGKQHNYSSHGGLVVGYRNTISGAYASVTGGYDNEASGGNSSVSGGNQNLASGYAASMSGGYWNESAGTWSSVSGGRNNLASGDYSSVSGGGGEAADEGNIAFGTYSSILGGMSNIAGDRALLDHWVGTRSTISGGRNNVASGDFSHVSGGGGPYSGDSNIAFGTYTSILGGMKNIAGDVVLLDHGIGSRAAISGGRNNYASGDYSSVSGGKNNWASASTSSVSGGKNNFASASISSVSGGEYNVASGDHSNVSGGSANTASGHASQVSGGCKNTASASYCSVSGGYYNTASDSHSSVSGGYLNEASGVDSSVSGGNNRTADGQYDWVAGSLFQDQ